MGVHLLERELYRAGLEQHLDSFVQPIRQLALIRFVEMAAPNETDLQAYMDVWDSALQAYYPQESLHRDPMTPGSKQSVSGQFGNRVAAIFGQDDYSVVAAMATAALFAKLAAHAKSKLFDEFFKSIDWPR